MILLPHRASLPGSSLITSCFQENCMHCLLVLRKLAGGPFWAVSGQFCLVQTAPSWSIRTFPDRTCDNWYQHHSSLSWSWSLSSSAFCLRCSGAQGFPFSSSYSWHQCPSTIASSRPFRTSVLSRPFSCHCHSSSSFAPSSYLASCLHLSCDRPHASFSHGSPLRCSQSPLTNAPFCFADLGVGPQASGSSGAGSGERRP